MGLRSWQELTWVERTVISVRAEGTLSVEQRDVYYGGDHAYCSHNIARESSEKARPKSSERETNNMI